MSWPVVCPLPGVHTSHVVNHPIKIWRLIAATKPYWNERSLAVLVVHVIIHVPETSGTCMVIMNGS